MKIRIARPETRTAYEYDCAEHKWVSVPYTEADDVAWFNSPHPLESHVWTGWGYRRRTLDD